MSLPDPKPGGCGEADDEGDRRASTGDFSVPIITSVSPGVDSVTEGTHNNCYHACRTISMWVSN